MSHIDPNLPLSLSVLNRLTDPATGGARGRAGFSAAQILAAVQIDLEELLNTRQSQPDIPAEYSEVRESILAYGLPDLTSVPVQTAVERENLAQILAAIVARFEPRLRDVQVQLLEDSAEQKPRTIRFCLEATLCVEPARHVAFDTLLELMTGHYSIRPREGEEF